MGAFASGVRDLALWLELGPATVVGHSLGGGVAMQFAYQFPERTERLALVSSGGLGRRVHAFLSNPAGARTSSSPAAGSSCSKARATSRTSTSRRGSPPRSRTGSR
jgi:pimeloyl-ACP methyl ester carboxylesterase